MDRPPIPQTLDTALSPQWLTAALRCRFPDVEIDAVRAGPIVDRVSTNARFTVHSSSGLPDGLPKALCVKGYFNTVGRNARELGESEPYFYRDLCPLSAVRTLRPVYADADPATHDGLVITEDEIAKGATFLDGSHDYSPSQVADSLTELARLHAETWCRPQWADPAWLRPRMRPMLEILGPAVTARIARNLQAVNGRGIPLAGDDADRVVRTYGALVEWLAAEVSSSPWCVIHGDAHVGNVYLDREGRPCLVDWQLVQRGMWFIDVGYHIASSLEAGERRKHERGLLRHYLADLGSFGVDAPPWDDAWPSLRHGILHGLFLWCITTKVSAPVIEILLRRLSIAAVDHEALF